MKVIDPFDYACDLIDPPSAEYGATPGEFSKMLEPNTIQTPALDLIDDHLVGVRDALATMFARRRIFSEFGHGDSDALERSIEQVPQEGIERLIVSMPPQEGKTERVSRRSALWMLCQFPGLRIGIVSYDVDNASRVSFSIRSDIESYQGQEDTVDLGLRLVYGQKAMSRWVLAPPHEGGVYATGIGGALTGRPLDMLIIDDPVKDVQAADSLLMSSRSWDWWSTVARPRLAPGAPAIVVATRWHEADLSGRLISQQRESEQFEAEHYDRWHVVNIPAQAEDEKDPLGRKPGQFMSSARGRSRAQWEATKRETPPRHWVALYQGKPSPEEGEIWLRHWWRRYNEGLVSMQTNGTYRVEGFEHVIQSWDCAFKGTDSSDYVVGQVWAKRGADSYLLYEAWKRMSFTETLAAIERVSRLFPQSHRKVIEEAANGAAVIDSLKRKVPGITPAVPSKSKVERANAVAPFIEAGNVHIPTIEVATQNPDIAWDPEAFLVETTSFPNAKNDDQVDAASQALMKLYLGNIGTVEVESRSSVRAPERVVGPTKGAQPWQRRALRRQGVH